MKVSQADLQNDIDEFISVYLKDKSPDTKGTYQRALREFQRYVALRSKTFNYTTEHILHYRNFLSQEKQFSAVTVSTYLTAVRRLCDFLVSKGTLQINPAKKVKGNRRPKTHSIGVLTIKEAELLKTSIPTDKIQSVRDLLMIRLMLECAVSEHELVSSNVGDFNLNDAEPYLFVKPKGKSAKTDKVLISMKLASSIQQYLSLRSNLESSSPLFASHGPNRKDQRLTTRAIRYRIKHWLEKTGINRQNISANSLRHTAAFLWLTRDKMPVEDVKLKMRHGMIETTEIYLSLDSNQPNHTS